MVEAVSISRRSFGVHAISAAPMFSASRASRRVPTERHRAVTADDPLSRPAQ
jgi:hypothetical protein